MCKEKIVLGFSGGTDSFVAALLLKQKGYEVIAVTLDLWDSSDSSCIDEAKRLAEEIGLEHHVVKAYELFTQKVVKPFVADYLRARTPSPCSFCNNHIKFDLLKKKADELSIVKIATGHYINILCEENKFYIHRGVDVNKDQSYFLWELSQEVLARSITPLGEYTKTEVREIASKAGFGRVAHKKESMGVCFLENASYVDLLRKYHPDIDEIPGEGSVFDEKGLLIGKHKGLPFYTVGQKKDLFLAEGIPALYVKSMCLDNNSIIAGNKPSLRTKTINASDYSFVDLHDISLKNITTNIRGWGLNPIGSSKISLIDDNHLSVTLEGDAWAVAPGQPLVFYVADRLIGGALAE